MKRHTLTLKILSPEKTVFEGEVTRVLFPGMLSPFTVLCNHAPLISALQRGVISWGGAQNSSITIAGGFVEVKDNVVTACVEF